MIFTFLGSWFKDLNSTVWLFVDNCILFVFQMEFDKTKWSCSWNSAENLAELPPSCTHRYNAVFEGQSSQAT